MMKKREFGPDAVRVFALFLLLWLHYWLRNGFYYEKADTIPALISGITLEIYLCSRLFDPIIYELGKGSYGPESYLLRGIAATLLVFGLTFLVAWPVHEISKYITARIWP